MRMLFAFYFGWAMGARSGPEGLDEIRAAVASLRHSEEFQGLLTALRQHAAHILRDAAGRVEAAGDAPLGVPDVLARIYEMVQPPSRRPAE